MEYFLFAFYVGDLLVILLLGIVLELSLITPRMREAENLPAPGKGGDQALCRAWLCMQIRASSIASHLTAGTREGLHVSSCIELRCPGVNVWVGASENGREKTKLTKCTWCTCR